ncbi:FAD-dependent oxidoreductase, partial [Pseudomonas aeruginosa]|uniref:FAD-dependent oxidoreductase n=1 Tax=Pseudomonas aeruginosa TaxID=287 RepID=UPI0039A230BE
MNAEVIVVGAGIVGSACAHELACRGLDVLVLDSRRGGAPPGGGGGRGGGGGLKKNTPPPPERGGDGT